MSDKENPTDPYASDPPESIDQAKRFAMLVKAMIDPIHAEVTEVRKYAEQTNRFVVDLVRRYDDIRRDLDRLTSRVTNLEKKTGAE